MCCVKNREQIICVTIGLTNVLSAMDVLCLYFFFFCGLRLKIASDGNCHRTSLCSAENFLPMKRYLKNVYSKMFRANCEAMLKHTRVRKSHYAKMLQNKLLLGGLVTLRSFGEFLHLVWLFQHRHQKKIYRINTGFRVDEASGVV